MPRVVDFRRLRVTVYPNDHPPPHVHVIGRGCEAVFLLNCPAGPVMLRENYGFARRDISLIRMALSEIRPILCHEWESLHGLA